MTKVEHCKDDVTSPNIIWIFADQLRAQALGCNGDPNISTPNIDRLAATGVNFTAAVSGFPLCCPFRGSLLTSKYPHKCVPGHQYRMPPHLPTIASVFNAKGYHTAYFGKWHLDGCDEKVESPTYHIVPRERRGEFQTWMGYENNNSQWDTWIHGHYKEDEEISIYRLPAYETDELTSLLIDHIKKRVRNKPEENSPFFAVLSVQPPHDPYVAPEEDMQKHNMASITLRKNVPKITRVVEQARRELSGYYAQIRNLDRNVGRIIRTIHEEGLADNTYIMFFSDHGDMHGSHGQFRKTTPYQEAIQIPMIISGGNPEKHGRIGYKTGRFNVPVNHVDIAPTTLGLCGIEKPQWMEGTDYSHYRIKGKPPVDEPDSAYLQGVIPTGHYDSIDRAWRGIVTKNGWKYVCFENVPWQMFNLNEDPYEQANLVHNPFYAHERDKLNDRLAQWIDETGDEFMLSVKSTFTSG